MGAMTGAQRGEPYIGLRPYDSDDRFRFFGRDQESHEVASLWLGNRLLVLHGPSGVGKTSLICAGVTPVVSAEAEVLPVGRLSRGSAFPMAALREHNPYTFAVLSSWSPGDALTRLSGLSIVDFLSTRRTRTDRYGDPMPTLVAIDRFEEFFHDSPDRWRYRDEFIRELALAVERLPHLRLLIAIRDDSLADFLPYETQIAGHSRARFRLRPLSRESALAAVKRPMEATDRSFAPGVAEELVDSLRTVTLPNSIGETSQIVTEALEPVQLQVVCSELWRDLPDEAREVTAEHLHDHGDSDRTLARFCADAIARVANDHGEPVAELRGWLERTFITELGTRGTVYEGLSTTGGKRNTVVRALEDHHILKCERRSGSRWYELAHDRLIGPIRRLNQPEPVAEQELSDASASDYLRAAEAALADGELTLSEKHAEEALRLCVGVDARLEAEAESFLANVAMQRGQHQVAERRYRRAAELFELLQDQNAVGWLLAAVGALRLKQGQYAAAVKEWQGAMARLPGDLDVQVDLARAFSCSGQLQAAVAVYSGVLTVAPESADALSGRGQIRADLGDAATALEDLNRLTALHPRYEQHPDVRSARGLALITMGRAEQGSGDLSVARRDAPDDGIVLLRAAKAARVAGDHEAARQLARRALSTQGQPLLPHQAAEADMIVGTSQGGGESRP
jgi:tetratricopeptide (TPR) repeat protein